MDGESTASLASHASAQARSQWKKCFLMFMGNLLSYSLCPLPFVLALGSTEKSLFPSSLYLLQLFKSLYKVPPSLLQAKQLWLSYGSALPRVSNTPVS